MTEFNFKSLLSKKISKTLPPNFNTLGLNCSNRLAILSEINKKNTLVLFTGVGNAGKTTTVYSLLNQIPLIKRITVLQSDENYILIRPSDLFQGDKSNPSEYVESFIEHLDIFKPDIIAFDELEDIPTSRLILEAHKRGITCLVTLFSASTLKTFTRLKQILDTKNAQELFNATTMIVSQQLLHKLCIHCKVPTNPTKEELAFMGISLNTKNKPTLYVPKDTGCKLCNHRGYQGKLAIQEVLKINADNRALLENYQTIKESKKKIDFKINKKIRQDGIDKVKDGLTNLDELVLSSIIEINSNS